MLLEICIPTWNRGLYLDLLLEDIAAFASAGDVYVTIADNGSTDHTPEVVETLKDQGWLRCLRWEENRGFDRNVQRLLDSAVGEYVWLVSDDDRLDVESCYGIIPMLKERPDAIWVNIAVSGDMSVSDQMGIRHIEKGYFYNFIKKCGVLGFTGGLGHLIVRRDLLRSIDRNAFVGTNYCHVFSHLYSCADKILTAYHNPAIIVDPKTPGQICEYVERWGMQKGGVWDYSVFLQARHLSDWIDCFAGRVPLDESIFRMYVGMRYPYQLLCLRAAGNLIFSGQDVGEDSLAVIGKLCRHLSFGGYQELWELTCQIAMRGWEPEAARAWEEKYTVLARANWLPAQPRMLGAREG